MTWAADRLSIGSIFETIEGARRIRARLANRGVGGADASVRNVTLGDGRSSVTHCRTGGYWIMGSERTKEKRVPSSPESTWRVLPIASTSVRTIASPRPALEKRSFTPSGGKP